MSPVTASPKNSQSYPTSPNIKSDICFTNLSTPSAPTLPPSYYPPLLHNRHPMKCADKDGSTLPPVLRSGSCVLQRHAELETGVGHLGDLIHALLSPGGYCPVLQADCSYALSLLERWRTYRLLAGLVVAGSGLGSGAFGESLGEPTEVYVFSLVHGQRCLGADHSLLLLRPHAPHLQSPHQYQYQQPPPQRTARQQWTGLARQAGIREGRGALRGRSAGYG